MRDLLPSPPFGFHAYGVNKLDNHPLESGILRWWGETSLFEIVEDQVTIRLS
jgi:hypothetical protein